MVQELKCKEEDAPVIHAMNSAAQAAESCVTPHQYSKERRV